MSDLRENLEQAYASADLQSQEPENVVTSEDVNTEPAEPVEIITAPNSYKQEYKDSFNTLPHDWQKYLSAREKEVEQGLSRARNQYSWVDKIYNDRKEALTRQGYKDQQDYFNTLVGIADSLETDPQGTLLQLQSIYGVSNNNDNVLQRQVAELSQRVASQQSYLKAQEDERARQELNAFVNAKDETGNLKNTHFNEVKDDMIKLLSAGLATNLDDAYSQAIWRVESVRNKILADKTKHDLEQKVVATNKAKSASFDPQSKTEGKTTPLSLRETLERNFDLLGE
jgi:hypothetical protein